MKCSCLSVLLVYATRRTANCVALAILIGTYQLVNDIHARRGNGNACVRTCETKMKMILKTKKWVNMTACHEAMTHCQKRSLSPQMTRCHNRSTKFYNPKTIHSR